MVQSLRERETKTETREERQLGRNIERQGQIFREREDKHEEREGKRDLPRLEDWKYVFTGREQPGLA